MIEKDAGDRNRSFSETSDNEYDPQYQPIIQLPEVVIPTNEEDEEAILVLRAKLYRFDKSDDIPEWKERGTGELKMLKHRGNNTVRIVMRRDKTLKVCANHFITPPMELKPKPGHDKAFIYTVPADFSDGFIKSECLAIKFGSVDFANQFQKAFIESHDYVLKECKLYNGTADEEEEDDEEELSDEESSDDADEKDAENGEKEKDDKTDEVTDKLNELNVSKENGL